MGRTRQGRTLNFAIGYDPLPSQTTFHASDARFKGFSGPIGSGKSQALCQEAIRLAFQNPGRMGLIGAPTYPMLRDSTQRAVLEVLDENDLPYEFNKSTNELVLKYADSKIAFRSLDDFERLRGTNLAWFGVDELTYAPEQAWLRLEGRLRDPKAKRLCGFAVWTPSGSVGNGDQTSFGIDLPAGFAVDLYGLQAEAQPGASAYRKTLENCGIYPAARFDMDSLTVRSDAANSHSTLLRIMAITGA